MHDEDNKFGLWVENALGDTWVAYGDARYRDAWNAANRRVMKRALQQSMDEVWGAFDSGQVRDRSNSQVLPYLPKLITEITVNPTADKHRADPRNWAPLFWQNPSDGNVMRRNDLQNPADRTYSKQAANFLSPGWGISSTVLDIEGSDACAHAQRGIHESGLASLPERGGARRRVRMATRAQVSYRRIPSDAGRHGPKPAKPPDGRLAHRCSTGSDGQCLRSRGSK